MRYKISSVILCVFLIFMCLSNIVSNANAIKEKFPDVSFTPSFVKSAILFARDSENLNAPFLNQYIEVNGLFHNICGKRYVFDAGDDVVKLETGHLAFASTNEIKLDETAAASYVLDFNEFTKESDVDLLYISVPNKMNTSYDLAPTGVYPLYGDVSGFLSLIQEGGVNCIDMAKVFASDGIDQYDYYFRTDHHWTPEGAFIAFQKTVKAFEKDFGYEIDEKLVDGDEYIHEKYENYFTGSEGKRTGKIFAGKDDFTLIYPKFPTDMEMESWNTPSSSQEYTYTQGDFSDTIFDDARFNIGGTYTYGTYLGNEATKKIIRNFNADNDKKIMLITDSFGSAYAPLLSLLCSELYIIDMRHSDMNIKELTEEYDIDSVVVLYSNNTIMDVDIVLNFDKISE